MTCLCTTNLNLIGRVVLEQHMNDPVTVTLFWNYDYINVKQVKVQINETIVSK